MNRIFPGGKPAKKSGYCGQCAGKPKSAAVMSLPSYSLADADLTRSWDAGGDKWMGYSGDRLKRAEAASDRAYESTSQLEREAEELVDAAREELQRARSSGGDKAATKAAKAKLRDDTQARKRAKKMSTRAIDANLRNRVPVVGH